MDIQIIVVGAAFIFLVIVSGLLVHFERETIVNKFINFIGIFSGLIGIISIFINFNILTEVKKIEETRQISAELIKDQIYIQEELSRVEQAINRLYKVHTKDELFTEQTRMDLVLLKNFYKNHQDVEAIKNVNIEHIEFIDYTILNSYSDSSVKVEDFSIPIQKLQEFIGALEFAIKEYRATTTANEIAEKIK